MFGLFFPVPSISYWWTLSLGVLVCTSSAGCQCHLTVLCPLSEKRGRAPAIEPRLGGGMAAFA